MITFPNCKINLGLYVTGRRNDGFHNLESVFIPVSCSDALEVIESPDGFVKFDVSGADITSSTEDNICMKAYRLLQNEFELPAIHAHLLKQIPMGAGLGGGSSDGSSMLKLLDELFNLQIGNDRLKSLAVSLGSDCPFFIDNKPAFVSGRGEMMELIEVGLNDCYIAIVHPNIHVGTAEAYSMISPSPAGFDLRSINAISRKDWKDYIHNDFEKPISLNFPIITEIKNELYRSGAFFASMSGSGSAVYGLFECQPDLNQKFGSLYCWQGKM